MVEIFYNISIMDQVDKYCELIEFELNHYEKWQLILGSMAMTLSIVWVARAVNKREEILAGIKKRVFSIVKALPPVKRMVKEKMGDLEKKIEEQYLSHFKHVASMTTIPEKPMSAEKITEMCTELLQAGKHEWKKGYMTGATFSGLNGKPYEELLTRVYGMTAWTNPLHADVFPGVRKMEAEIVRMVSTLFNGDDNSCGCVTSGGTESLLLMMKAYRDWAYHTKGITEPEAVICVTGHAAIDKGGEYMKIKIRKAPVDPKTYKCNIKAMKKLINKNTIFIMGSTPQYPHGIVDDIAAMSELGLKYNIGVHVDCCFGGFLLPFMDKAGYPIAPFDFRLKGVTSITADTHKYGNSPKGSSVVMYRNEEFRHYQYFATPSWPGGLYITPTVAGSRAGGLISVCWAALLHYGMQGYVEQTRNIIATARKLKAGVLKIEGIETFGDPITSIVSIKSSKFDILRLADVMTEKGWHFQVVQFPPGVQICITPVHCTEGLVDGLLKDLKDSAKIVKDTPPSNEMGNAQMYGATQKLPDREIVSDVARIFMEGYYKT